MRMDFARRQLEKTGWKYGCGLGKHENGAAQPVKATIKMDTRGLGFDPGKEFSHDWWTMAFNKTAEKLSVTNTDSRSSVQVSQGRECSSGKSGPKGGDLETYRGFVKESVVPVDSPIKNVVTTEMVSDDELFLACGGRTAHRAARHGLKLSGKLKRLAKQEHKSSSIKNGKLLVVECKAKKHCQRIDGVAQKECSPSLNVDVYQSVGSNDGVCVCKHKKPKRRFQRVSVVLQKECSL
ncbi:G patch domain-containing protein 4-like [Corticium candelabrum]|uniref:G patch domain-containing protein 4-like n=1 Tax=Corticium candelabrum TaxID=121492 RepID=UPI002E26FC7D|nr:G patch domain-containing protein 4-like [Corticium candelabrum]